MNLKLILRVVSVIMLLAGLVFLYIAISAPTFGRVLYVGNIRFDAERKRIFYAVYWLITVVLFLCSFLVKNKR